MGEGIMVSAANQIVFEIASVVISAVVTMAGVYLREYIKTNKFVKEYNLYNEKTERVLANAIMYAEAKAKDLAHDSITKRDISLKYIEKMSPDIIQKEGDKLEMMLDRKVEQLFEKQIKKNRKAEVSKRNLV